MLVKDLIEQLKSLPQDMEIAILDGYGGGGAPRTINFGPEVRDENYHTWADDENLNYSDIVSENTQQIVVMGFHNY